jgi:hypothetical protein
MVMIVGDASEDASRIQIYYSTPGEKVRNLVRSGTLFFEGTVDWATGIVEGQARIYKSGCSPQEYSVSGLFSGSSLVRPKCRLTQVWSRRDIRCSAGASSG